QVRVGLGLREPRHEVLESLRLLRGWQPTRHQGLKLVAGRAVRLLLARQERDAGPGEGHEHRGAGEGAHAEDSPPVGGTEGRVIVTTVPLPRDDSRWMLPPCSSTARRAIDSPRPVPPFLVEK